MPTAFSHDTTDCQEWSCYILEDVLACPVGCRVIICIRADAHGNPTEQSYSDQAMRISDSRKTHNIKPESWRMAGDQYFMMQGTIMQATLHDKLQSCNLSQGCFKKYCDNCSGDIGVSFDGCDTILSIPWQDIVHYLHIIMFFGKPFDQLHPWGLVFRFKNNLEYTHHEFCQFEYEYFGDFQASSQLFASYNRCLCNICRVQCVAAESCQ